ncbi:PCI domain-containing protein [Lentinula raphanica]|nr:PCI domain-containing protein [Lentinula raphanica]
MKSTEKDEKKDEKKQETTQEEVKKEPPTPLAEIKGNFVLIDRAVSTLEPRFTHRVLRTLTTLVKKIDEGIIRNAIEEAYPKDSATKAILLSWIPLSASGDVEMQVDSAKPASITTEPVPEIDIYLRLLIIHQLLKSKENVPKAKDLSVETVQKMQALNRRSLDSIAAKVWYALERAFEINGDLAEARPLFLAAQQTVALRHDDNTQASLINRLLRSYLAYSLYDQADKLVSKTMFPVSAGNPQYARYHYYLGRIKAVQLNYSDAHTNLQQAIRRAPPATVAPGFYQAVHKLFVVVELLMGDIPDRGIFRHPVLEKPLKGYFEIVKAVRTGSLSQFQQTVSKHAALFQADKTHTLITRLRQNVIKTGIRRLSLAYSLISLKDICVKLHLDSEEDAEYIVGKAIRDGVGGVKRGYGSEVTEIFSRRIGYCLELHNQSVKASGCAAMRYPLNAHRKELADAEGAREREKELAKEIQEGDLDEEDLGGEF